VAHDLLMEKSRWEGVAGEPGRADYTDRLRVPGGWLFRTRAAEGVALVFVPGTERRGKENLKGEQV
jgi:hypothetical protein